MLWGNIAKTYVREPNNPAELTKIVFARREEQSQPKVWKYAMKQIAKVEIREALNCEKKNFCETTS